MKKIIIMLVCLSLAASAAPCSAPTHKNKAKYEKRYSDPVLKALEEAREKEQAALDEETAQIRKRQAEEKKKEQGAGPEPAVGHGRASIRPPSPAACKPVFHFPPVAQYNTNTCWSFSTTSYLRVGDLPPERQEDQALRDVDRLFRIPGKGAALRARTRRLAGGRGRREQRPQPHLERPTASSRPRPIPAAASTETSWTTSC